MPGDTDPANCRKLRMVATHFCDRSFQRLDRQFETMVGTRRRQLERPLHQIDAMRQERNLPIEGQLFGGSDELDGATDGADDSGTLDVTPPNVRRLGA